MNLHDFGEALYGTTPPPTADRYAAARAYVTRCAPDLLDMLFGEDS